MSNSLYQSSRRIALPQCHLKPQIRHATLLRRPKRPYTFTQLVTLTDGSSYLHRTTSPSPIYKVTKDVRNSPLWNPSSQKLLNIEEDDAGKLKAFRSRFGRGWDGEIDAGDEVQTEQAQPESKGEQRDALAKEESLMDLIGSYGSNESAQAKAKYLHIPASEKNKKK